MQIQEDEILSPRIRMHINGHRFLAAFRVDHPAHPEPTEYANFATEDDVVISVVEWWRAPDGPDRRR